jgi:hypothetical protein
MAEGEPRPTRGEGGRSRMAGKKGIIILGKNLNEILYFK